MPEKWLIFDNKAFENHIKNVEFEDDEPMLNDDEELLIRLDDAIGLIELEIKSVVVEYKHEAGMYEEEKHTIGDIFEDWKITGFRLEVE